MSLREENQRTLNEADGSLVQNKQQDGGFVPQVIDMLSSKEVVSRESFHRFKGKRGKHREDKST